MKIEKYDNNGYCYILFIYCKFACTIIIEIELLLQIKILLNSLKIPSGLLTQPFSNKIFVIL